METQQLSRSPNTTTGRSTVDTSRPFRSVKEAVAIFGERLLAGDLHHSPKPFHYTNDSSPPRTPQRAIGDTEDSGNGGEEKALELAGAVKKLEAELEETKAELRLLKERESETEVALASLNAELHKNMSKIAEAEAAEAAAKAVALRRGEAPSPTLAQILSLSERAGGGNSKTNKREQIKMTTTKKKKKPIIPLVSDLFSWKRRQSTTKLHTHLYASSKLYL